MKVTKFAIEVDVKSIPTLNLILPYTPLDGVVKYFTELNKILPDGPYMPGNWMRYLQKWDATKRGE